MGSTRSRPPPRRIAMNEMIVAPVVTPAPLAHPVFPPIYYDQSETQVVLGFEVTAADQLTAVITAGAPYFRVSTIDVCDWVTDVEPVDTGVGELPRAVHQVPSSVHPQPPRVTRHLSDPVATSDGVKPLAVKTGQFARLWVTANVPKGSPLSPGLFRLWRFQPALPAAWAGGGAVLASPSRLRLSRL